MKNHIEHKVESEFGTIVCKFPVLHGGWEHDSVGYIVEKEHQRMAVLTNHGTPYICTLKELNDKIAFYKEVIQQTERCVYLLDKRL